MKAPKTVNLSGYLLVQKIRRKRDGSKATWAWTIVGVVDDEIKANLWKGTSAHKRLHRIDVEVEV